MGLVAKWRRRIEKKYRVIYKRGPSTLALIFAVVAVVSWAGFLLSTGYPLAQYAYYRLKPRTSATLAKALQETATAKEIDDGVANPAQTPPDDMGLPERDVSLPDGHYLSIPAIGVDTTLWEAPLAEYESALKRGVWRVPDFATPENARGGWPVILAAHRFGYLEWSQEYRKTNSFFNVPKLKPGDQIELVWDKRRYRYQVLQVEEGKEIGSYDHDLILYTCKFLVSPERVFVYAKRV